MTVNELVQYYQDLLILQYRNKPKALATIDAMVRPTAIDLLPASLASAFDMDTAVGVQLDILGKYIGITRKVATYTTLVILNDADYRAILKIKRALNNIGSSMYDITRFISEQLLGSVTVIDSQNMMISFVVDSNNIAQNLFEAIIVQNLLPKPMGVGIDLIVYIPDANNMYGWVSYSNTLSSGISGFNSYASYQTDAPWLQYSNVI